MAIAGYFILFSRFGISLYGSREVARFQENPKVLQKTFSELFSLNFGLTLIVSLIYFLCIFLVPKFWIYRDYHYVLLVMVSTSFLSIDWCFSGLEKFKFLAVRNLIFKVINIIVIILFVVSKKDGLVYLGIIVLINLLTNFSNFYGLFLVNIKPTVRFKGLRKHLSPMVLLFSTNLAVSVYTALDTIMLGFLNTFDQVGYYTIGTKLIKVVLPIILVGTSVFVSRLTNEREKGETNEVQKNLDKSFSLIAFVAPFAAITLFLMSREIIIILFGDEYINSIIILKVLSPIILIAAISNFLGLQILVTHRLESKLFRCIVVGALFNVLGNYFLIPTLGARGASISTLLSELIILGLTWKNVVDLNLFEYRNRGYLLIMLSSFVVLLPTVVYFNEIGFLYKIVSLGLSGIVHIIIVAFFIENIWMKKLINKIFR